MKILNIMLLSQIILILKRKNELYGFYKIIFGSNNDEIKSLEKEWEDRWKQLKAIEEAKKL